MKVRITAQIEGTPEVLTINRAFNDQGVRDAADGKFIVNSVLDHAAALLAAELAKDVLKQMGVK